ncbi:thiamine pyrophosphate-binding protein [Benzoatithermus flavus]|uniref:Thiamine pyrophosphate-binding protein n=1 Tax=Benzoatithermus flavus TaxID=3108223 RepID=A0ABU8XLG2_9PROT
MAGQARTGGRILVDQLRIQGVEVAFGVPGESYLEVLDALHDTPEIRFVVCRQEGGAAMMAAAWGELTGRPGVAFVTRGPGATNASAGVHVAQQDSLPMVLFVGQVDRGSRERDTFQEVDYRRMFGGMAKWVAEIDDPARIPEFVHRAFATATAGRPGPVVLALPEDMLVEKATVVDGRAYRPVEAVPGADELEQLRHLLERSVRPFVILGGSGWSAAGTEALAAFLDRNDLPAACGFRRQDILDNRHRCYAGHIGLGANPKLIERIRSSDLVIAIGSRLGETTSQSFMLLDVPRPQQRFVHVHNDPEELGRVYQPDLPILAGLNAFARAVAALPPVSSRPWAAATAEAHEVELAWRTPAPIPGALQYGEIVAWLRRELPEETIVTNGAGNYAIWVNRFFPYPRLGTQLAPTSGSMGYGLPAAIAAKLACPDRPVVSFAGDGCFLMTGQELATAVQHELPIITIVVDNGMYGTIRMHQEREHPGRVSGTSLKNPDFAALARAYGAFGARVERTEEFAPAFAEAVASGRPALLHLILDPEAITPRTSLSEIRAAARAAGR